jgi:hypothetical protein
MHRIKWQRAYGLPGDGLCPLSTHCRHWHLLAPLAFQGDAIVLTRRAAILGVTSGLLIAGARAQAQLLKTTPTGDIGPFYPVVRSGDADNDLTLIRGRGSRAAGQVIEVSGRILDRHERPVSGARAVAGERRRPICTPR